MARAPFTPNQPGGPGGGQNAGRFQAAQQFQRALAAFLADEGVAAVVTPGRGDDGTVFNAATGSRDAKNPTKVPAVIFSTEHYGRIARMVEKGVPVTVELDVKNTFLIVEHEYGPARTQDKARLAPVLAGSIAFTRKIDEAAGCMYALQHQVLPAQGIPVQGRGREPYRS